MKKSNKKESIEEYLARGGQVTKVARVDDPVTPTPTIAPMTTGPANLLTYGEADLYYGEVRARKPKKSKPVQKIDIDSLPKALRDKYFKELLDE